MRLLALTLCVGALSACNTNPAPPTQRAAAPAASAAPTAESADVAALRAITRILIDASALYSAAADDSENRAYAEQLRSLSASRTDMTDAFQARVASLGGAPAESGQALGTAHRMFMEARTLGDDDTKVAVQEALRGENYLRDQLSEKAQDASLSAETRAFITRYIAPVTAGRDRLQSYADSLG